MVKIMQKMTMPTMIMMTISIAMTMEIIKVIEKMTHMKMAKVQRIEILMIVIVDTKRGRGSVQATAYVRGEGGSVPWSWRWGYSF